MSDIPFKTTLSQIKKIPSIVKRMQKSGVQQSFLDEASRLAQTDQGVYELMELWSEENDLIEREKIIIDLRKSLVDCFCVVGKL